MTKTEFTELVKDVLDEAPVKIQEFITDWNIAIIIDDVITPEIMTDLERENPGFVATGAEYASFHGLYYGLYRPGIGPHIRLYWKTIMTHPKADKKKIIKDCFIDGLGNILGQWKTLPKS